MMWIIPYVVGSEVICSFLVSIWYIRKYPPGIDHIRPAAPIHQANISQRIFHVSSAIFFVIVLLYEVIATHGHSVAFYTCWNFTLQTLYWFWAFLDPGARSHLRKVLFDIAFPTMWLVATVVWLILYPMAKNGDASQDTIARLLNWRSYIQHGGNAVLFSIEFAWNEPRVMPLSGLPVMTLWCTLYVGFAWIVHTWTKFWPYPFMKMDQETMAPLWYAVMLLLHCFWFVVVRCATHSKLKLSQQKQRLRCLEQTHSASSSRARLLLADYVVEV
jgi:hypothetical protein